MMEKRPDEKLPAEEAERASDEALRRMLKTPPKPLKDEFPKTRTKHSDNH
jgi:hypothetical protein